jgi:hypothetical protein
MAKNRRGRGRGTTRRVSKRQAADESTEITRSPELPNLPGERDIVHHLQTIKAFADKAKTASSNLTAAKKRAREAGIDLGAVALTMGFRRLDALAVTTMLSQLSAMMRIDGQPVQISVFDAKYDAPEAQAKVEGFADGKAGRSPNTARWPEGTPAHDSYMAAWKDGTASNVKTKPDRGNGKEFDKLAPQQPEQAAA